MEYSITLPTDFQSMTVKRLLEEEWLVPRKVRHFLRTRRNVKVNGKQKMFHELVAAGDSVTLEIEDSDYVQPKILAGDKTQVKVLYEDEHLIVVNKPAGTKTHPNQPEENDTMLNHIADYLAEKQQLPYVVHRLDKETSGVILFAKNPFVLPIFGRMLEQREISRTYQAIVRGSITEDLVINKKIGRDRHDRRKRIIEERNGKPAVTRVQVIESGQNSKILCHLDTGRTHQIRVHLLSIGHPVIGDPLYNPKSRSNRLQLHASELSMIHPFTKESITVNAEPELW